LVHFLHFSILETEEQEFFKVEGFMEGEFKKISNNFDQLNTEFETRHLTAFSHYTFENLK
jgi:hypothetical protein